jgi:hypothetical protein
MSYYIPQPRKDTDLPPQQYTATSSEYHEEVPLTKGLEQQEKFAPTSCRDLLFTILFIFHLV